MSQEPNAHEPSHHDHGAGEAHKPEPDEHAIRGRAHEIWVSEGMPEGREVEHWLRARRDLGLDLDMNVGSD
jgi:hypothetical protein